MKLWEIFRFELAYQVRRAWPWLIVAALFVFTFLMARDTSLNDALRDDFYANSPFTILKTTVFGSLIWLLVGAVIAGEAAARDVSTGMHPLTYTVPVSKADYLGGRFLAAFALNALMLLAVQVAIMVAVYSPGVDDRVIGPFRVAGYLAAYAFISLPNAFIGTALQFSIALRSGRPMAGYVGSLFLFFMGFFVASFLLFRRGLGTLLDPIGIRFVVEDIAHLWTTVEKNTRVLAFEGIVLENRLAWLGIALTVLAITWLRFRFAHRTVTSWWSFIRRRRDAHPPVPARIGVTETAPIAVPHVAQTSGFGTHARQTLAIAWGSFRAIATSLAGLGLLVGIPMLTVLIVIDQMVSSGAPLVPATALVIPELTAPLSDELSRWVIIPLAIVFFAGELVWRERDAGLGEIADAMPISEWVPFLGKLLGVALVLVVLMALLATAGIVAQAIRGHQDFQVGLYLKTLLGLQLSEYLLFTVVALVVHVLVNQKYVGHLVAIVAYAFMAMASLFGVEHNLLVYGAGPGWSYTEMRGFGSSIAPWSWFKLYWAAWALLLTVAARLLWVRGRESNLRVRLQSARLRLARSTAAAGAVAVALILTLGGFIFYNTNVRNEYLSGADLAERGAEYERRYARYARVPQPRVAKATLDVEIHPERRAVDIHGSYRLVNRDDVAIDSVHVAIALDAETRDMKLDRPATRVVDDDQHGHRIYALERPLQPGDSLLLDFRVHVAPRGFRESGVDPAVVANGTVFTQDWLPAIGYQRMRELINPSQRREHGLAERPVIPSLYDVDERKDRGGGIAFEAVVGTSEDQVAVAPGALRRTWTERGRRYFHYVTDGPIGGEWTFFSARYAVHRARWKDSAGSGREVAIQIFHHPAHSAHLDRMVRSIRASLDYYGREFGPYRYNHITFAERPGNGTGMHADASMMWFTEGTAFWNPKNDPGSLDFPFAVAAHEIAHQWSVPIAFAEGAPVMSESLAWYYAMRLVEETYGGQVRRLLRFMRRPHPIAPIRRGEPLLRGLDPYMSYRKGPFALWALGEYVGEERVNRALRRLRETHLQEGAPLATTLDLYRELKAVTPDSLQYLLHDLFEVNTYWQLETERVTAKETGDGAWQVTLDVRARKVVFDSAGVETEVRMDEWVPIGVFAAGEKGWDELSAPLYLRMHRVRSGDQTITVTVPRQPVLAGIDPHHLLDIEEGENDDNIEGVKIERRAR